jgi:arginine/lysine/ornithine decarboxylase
LYTIYANFSLVTFTFFLSIDALACGADIVVQSSHKTLTALSQAAMMHLGNNAFSFYQNRIDSRIDKDRGVREGDSDSDRVKTEGDTAECPTEAAGMVLHDCFSMLTTTSPNMALLASLDATRAQMARDGADMIQGAAASADEIRYELRLQNAFRIEKTDGPAGGGVELLDDSASVRPAKRLKANKESESKVPGSDSPQWLVDPLRLTVRFPGRLALDVDDKMCEGENMMLRHVCQ